MNCKYSCVLRVMYEKDFWMRSDLPSFFYFDDASSYSPIYNCRAIIGSFVVSKLKQLLSEHKHTNTQLLQCC